MMACSCYTFASSSKKCANINYPTSISILEVAPDHQRTGMFNPKSPSFASLEVPSYQVSSGIKVADRGFFGPLELIGGFCTCFIAPGRRPRSLRGWPRVVEWVWSTHGPYMGHMGGKIHSAF